jgi:hypothetical protein
MPVNKPLDTRMPSSGMWRRVNLVNWTDVSEERVASIFRVEKSASEEPSWAGSSSLLPPTHSGSSFADFSILKMGATRSSETSVQFTRSTRRHIPEDGILHSHRCENLKSYTLDTRLSYFSRLKGMPHVIRRSKYRYCSLLLAVSYALKQHHR